ncbi:MAG: substrate-binding domain-containing protein [Candidatus Hydrogenedentes bacterium]|nr:substrate-binding domain-containing protein [Candidatus Hydrogenedentota bacterium]
MKATFTGGTALVLTLVLAACGGPPAPAPGTPPPAKQKTVGASLLTQTHVFYQDMVEAMQAAATANNLNLRIQYAEFDTRRQNDQIDTFLAQGVDALLIAPTDSSGIAPVIAQASSQGVPVFTVDIAAPGTQTVSHIASDNEKGGFLLGQYLAKLLNNRGKVAIIDHPIVTSVQDRTRGFENALKGTEITIVQRVPGDGQRDKAFRVAQDLLQAQPDLNAIFGINDDSALGALAAIEAANLQDKILIVGFDGTPEARDQILKGTALKADAVQFPKKVGAQAIETVAAALRGEQVPPLVPVPVEIIDQASLQAEQPSS